MVSVKKVVASALVGALMFTAVGCGMVEKTQAAIDKTTVATVNGEKITIGEVDTHLQGMFKQLETQYGKNYKENPDVAQQILQQRKSTLQGMVSTKVLGIEAEKLGVAPKGEELTKQVDDQFNNIKKAYGDNFDKILESEGFTQDSFKEFIKENTIAESAINYAKKDIKVTDEEAKKYYDENKAQFVAKDKGIMIQHLLFENEAEAQKAYDEITSGKTTFEKLYDEYSKNKEENKKPIAEDLGLVTYENSGMVKEFEDAVKTLKTGEVSKPVKTQFGYHIIKAGNIYDKGAQESFEDVKPQIMRVLKQQKESVELQKTISKWEKELNVKTYDDKLSEGLKLNK